MSSAMKPGDPTSDRDGRKPWVTPTVVAADVSRSAAHVANGSDGTDPTIPSYQYGS